MGARKLSCIPDGGATPRIVSRRFVFRAEIEKAAPVLRDLRAGNGS
jgi:hypothetical protein